MAKQDLLTHTTPPAAMPEEGRQRVVINGLQPSVERGRYAVKRIVGEEVSVEANIYAEGHDALSACVVVRSASNQDSREIPMKPLVNERWRGTFQIERREPYTFNVIAFIDHFMTWVSDLKKRVAAEQDITIDLLIGADYVAAAAQRAEGRDANQLRVLEQQLRTPETQADGVATALSSELTALMQIYADRRFVSEHEYEQRIEVDRPLARFSAWYEMFPRSCASEPGRHGTLDDVERLLPYVQSMGFDVLYLPPIHPIGHAFRKGENNATTANPDDVGSPWAIGGPAGGHKSIHPELGTLEDFRRLVTLARKLGIEIAMDYALQCSPDHPYVKEHPDWFRQRPDGTIQYAENPPKKYQDIYPIDFETEDWQALWEELRSIILFWIEQGVTVFRVDNPHTKPFAFWEWMIGSIRREHSDIIFLAEAFTRPKVMNQLAKLGFTQSYTYFTWRNTKWEIEEYLEALTQSPAQEFLRPNFWPNTPDILPEYLQYGGRPAAMIRLVLAATLSACYGIYGPAFELGDVRPRIVGGEEYLDSEKYAVRFWNRDDPSSLREFIALVNRIRRENVPLQDNRTLRFHPVDNPEIICFSKTSPDGQEIIVVTVTMDPHHTQRGWLSLPTETFEISEERAFQAHDLLTGARYLWHGPHNFVELNPHVAPAHIFRLRRWQRSEHDFDYYL